MKQRKPLKKTPFKPKAGKIWKRLQPISKKKHRREARFIPKAVIEEVIIRSGGRCECVEEWPLNRISIRCHSDAQQFHHVLPRSRGGKHTKENMLHLCTTHHDICKARPIEAKKLGILK